MLLGATYSATAASTELCTKLEMSGRSMMLSPFCTSGMQAISTLGWPRSVRVTELKKGGSGIRVSRMRALPTSALRWA